MSAALRRDIFDLENVRESAEKIGSPQLLKTLTIMTYADIKAVNPDALTPWKAEKFVALLPRQTSWTAPLTRFATTPQLIPPCSTASIHGPLSPIRRARAVP